MTESDFIRFLSEMAGMYGIGWCIGFTWKMVVQFMEKV